MHSRRFQRVLGARAGRVKVKAVAVWSLLLLTLAAFVAAAVMPGAEKARVPTGRARIASFNALVVASGRIESTQSTEIRCTLERLSNGATPTILWIVPDGTDVKKDDKLCEIDSADFQEMVRTQKINLQQVKAAHRQAELTLEVAEIGMEAYKKGQMYEVDRQFRGQLALTESDLSTRRDRLGWTERMVGKGYATALQVATDKQAVLAATLGLKSSETAFKNYQQFTARKTLKAMESEIIGAKSQLGFQTIRLKNEEERLARYQRQIDNCVVKAPHDGFVIYANESGRAATIFEGAPVRQRQRLFTLPDLSKMEVKVLLHETVVNRVKVGMPVLVRLEALPDLEIEGNVSSISPLPLMARKSEQQSGEVTYFLGEVQLTKTPEGLRPGMSAELEIATARREHVLSVPATSVVKQGGIHVCTVVTRKEGQDHFDRRVVTVGDSSHDLVEITDGLDEGDEVLLITGEKASELVSLP